MARKNDITGAPIKSGILSEQGRSNWDEIFPPKKSANDWLANEYRHITMLDPDGWRYDDGVTLETKITRKEFESRLVYCTIMSKHAFYNLFLDDQREPNDAYLYDQKAHLTEHTNIPENGWILARNYNEFVDAIEKRGIPSLVSFDHDLALEHVRHYLKTAMDTGYIEYENFTLKSGKECAEYLVKVCKDKGIPLPRCYVHSANELGRVNIKKVLGL